MTRQEAIKNLRDIRDSMPFDKCDDWIQACNMAIRSLNMWEELYAKVASETISTSMDKFPTMDFSTGTKIMKLINEYLNELDNKQDIMTEQEINSAIKILEQQKNAFLDDWVDYGGVTKAYNLAIKALELQKEKAE